MRIGPTTTVAQVCGLSDVDSSPAQRCKLCPRCYNITTDASNLKQVFSSEGYVFETSVRDLGNSAVTESCRICSLALVVEPRCMMNTSLLWARLLEEYPDAMARVALSANLQPEDQRKSPLDMALFTVFAFLPGHSTGSGFQYEPHTAYG